VTAGLVLVALVATQRLGELVLARRNTRALLARGAVESGRGHYPLMVALHAAWLAASAWAAWAAETVAWTAVALLAAAWAARAWVMASLGSRWTTRIIALPGAPLVRQGPYRWLRHPNYLVVAAEVALLPMAFDAWRIALAFGMANAVLVGWRVRCEDAAM
jgi:methyltransferase